MSAFLPPPTLPSVRASAAPLLSVRARHPPTATASRPPSSAAKKKHAPPRNSPRPAPSDPDAPSRPPKGARRPRAASRAPPSAADLALHTAARPAAKLRAARTQLRRRHGVEPTVSDLVRAAHRSDASLSPHLHDWDSVFRARNSLTVKWLWLVAAVARKVYTTYATSFPEMRAALSHADLVQEGGVGLITAVERWDPGRGYPFESFAFYSIKQAILRAIENQSRPIRLPVHVLNKLAKMRKIRDTLERECGAADVETVAREAGVSVKAAELYMARSNATVSIDGRGGGGGGAGGDGVRRAGRRGGGPAGNGAGAAGGGRSGEMSLRDFLVDHSVDVAREVDRAITREAVTELLQQTDLLKLEREVVLLKYGLDDGVERMRAEVSRILDVRVHSVRRAEISALKKLRHTIGDDVSAWTELMA